MPVYDAASDSFMAACTFQEIHSQSVYLGYDVVKELRGQGLGTRVVKALIQLAHDAFPDKDEDSCLPEAPTTLPPGVHSSAS